MSLDRSLKAANALIRHRNVLTRAERLDKLKEEDRWKDGASVFGLPKVAHRKMAIAKEVKEPGAEGAAAGAGPRPRVRLRPRAPVAPRARPRQRALRQPRAQHLRRAQHLQLAPKPPRR